MKWTQFSCRLRIEGRDTLELVLLPGLAAVLPWRWCFALFRQIARCSWLYKHCEQEWEQANANGFGGVREDWLWRRRLLQLVDHADHYLHRSRSDGWMDRYIDVQGNWLEEGKPSFLFTFHWGAGMWALRHASRAGLKVYAMAAPAEGPAFAGRFVFQRYARARLLSVEQALGTELLLVPKGLRRLRKLIEQRSQVLALLDVPPEHSNGQVFEMLGIHMQLPMAMPVMAAEQDAAVVVYAMGLNVQTGRRFLQIQSIPAGTTVQEMTQTLANYLESLVQTSPAAWHFWGLWPRFVAPVELPQYDLGK